MKKKIRRIIAIIAALGFGVGAAACTSPVAPDTNEIDFGTNSSGVDFGTNSGGIDFGTNSSGIDFGTDS